MNRPLVSVCIPVYNGAPYIAETIASVQSQCIHDLEIVLQDNASTDTTWEIVCALASTDPRIRPERNPTNLGMAGNWNAVIYRATGRFVCLLSADDLFRPGFLTACLLAFRRDPDISFVSANHSIFGQGWERNRRMPLPGMRLRIHPALVLLLNPLSINFTLFSSELLSKHTLPEGGLFVRDLYTCDYELWLRLARARVPGVYLRTQLGRYRWHDANLSHQRLTMWQQTQAVIDRHATWLRFQAPMALAIIRFRQLLRRIRISHGH